MSVERVLDLADPRVAAYRHLSDGSLLKSHGLFVAEGRLVVRRIIENGCHTLRSLLVNGAAARSLGPLLETIGDRVPVYLCETADFLDLTGHHIHRGCLALVERPSPLNVRTLLESIAATDASSDTSPPGGRPATGTRPLRTPAILIVLEGVANADNVGGVFRNAAAFGAAAVLLSPTCCDPLYRKAIRTSMAATLQVPYARVHDWPRGLYDLRAMGFTIAALTPREPSLTLAAFAASAQPARVALLVGTEHEGLSAGAEAAADVRVRIPIAPAVDSLNLAVAAGIALHQLSAGATTT
jgi:tRNA G18 (ribose-2'-O)-methylase SpoU